MRRTKILQLADKSLEKYGEESPSQPGEFLFGPEFTKHLQSKVESDTSLATVVSVSQRYHPYSSTSRTPTINRSKQFFRGGPAEDWGPRQGKSHTYHTTPKSIQRPGHSKAKANLPAIHSPIEEMLNQLPPPLTAFRQLHLDLSLIATHRVTPVGGRLLLFAHNWEILTRDPWVLTTTS